MTSESILDASAFLAYLLDEPGVDPVAEAIGEGAVMSAANLTEALATIANRGGDPAVLTGGWIESGLLHGAILIEEFTFDDAIEAARLRPVTREIGLSLGDRACLALGLRLGFPVLTADRAWDALDIGVEIHLIR